MKMKLKINKETKKEREPMNGKIKLMSLKNFKYDKTKFNII